MILSLQIKRGNSMVNIIAHRGVWTKKSEQNSLKSFKLAFQMNYGIETDIREVQGCLVIAHDINITNIIPLEEVFILYNQYNCNSMLALNIKVAGVEIILKELLRKHNITNYFVFDQTIPDTVNYIVNNVHYYIRHSDYELIPDKVNKILYKNAKGVWLDQFELSEQNGLWFKEDILIEHLVNNKRVAIVSPELHLWGREVYKKLWLKYIDYFHILKERDYNLNMLAICTDYPTHVKENLNL